MPLTILDVEDIELGAKRKVDKLLKDYEFQFMQPQIDTALNMYLGQIYNKVNPKTAQKIDQLFTGGKRWH